MKDFLWVFNSRYDGDIEYLKSLHKRVNAFANKDAIPDEKNKLWSCWSNMKMMLNKEDDGYYTEVMYFSAVMAMKIDKYSENHLLSGDQTVAKILYEIDQLKPCSYELLEF